MPGSKLVVNNQVMLRGDGHHAAIGKSRLLYIANRPGAVSMRSEDDLRIEDENARMAKLGYIAYRPGSVPERNAGHALFDQHGIPERAKVQKELVATDSAIITSVVAVRREDAEAMRLGTKQDWERMLRSQWPRYVEALGVMGAEDVRWVAAYHVNQKNNLHCHVFTWDASGAFNSLIPKQAMRRANDQLRSCALRPQQEALNLARTQARDELVEIMRDQELSQEARQRVLSALPPEGSLKYANLAKQHPEAAETIDAAVRDSIGQSDEIAALKQRYLDAVRENAALKELDGARFEAYVRAAESDLDTRLGNALIANVRGESPAPLQHHDAFPSDDALLPDQRRRSQALAEEVRSCLTPGEAKALREGLQNAASLGEASDADTQKAMESLPTFKVSPALSQGLGRAVVENQARLAGLLDQASGSGRSSADEAGRETLSIGARLLGRAIELICRHALRAPAAKPPALTPALKQTIR